MLLHLQALHEGTLSLRAIARPALFVPDTMYTDELLVQFRKSKQHLAVLVDEFGGVSGIVTLEDLIEEIVGDIQDEYDDDDDSPVQVISDKEAILLGSLPLVDFNRQSLDRVVPGTRILEWRGQFEAAGWHVIELKYGVKLEQEFQKPGGSVLRDWIDAMPNEHYQSLFALAPAQLRERFLEGAPDALRDSARDIADAPLAEGRPEPPYAVALATPPPIPKTVLRAPSTPLPPPRWR